MSQENVDLVRQAWEAWERGDLTTALANISPDMVTYAASPLPFPGAYPGRDGLLRLQSEWAEGFDEVAVSTLAFIDAGEDKVVVRALHAARGAASGVPVETDVWYVFTIRAGKAIRADVFNDKAQAFEAAGLAA
jgi:ketosteroid isomerase-like protein